MSGGIRNRMHKGVIYANSDERPEVLNPDVLHVIVIIEKKTMSQMVPAN